MYTDTEELDAVSAVIKYGAEHDVLMMSWPTTVMDAYYAMELWGNKPIVFIGERPKPELGRSGLSGCATDEFHEATKVIHRFSEYKDGNMLEEAVVLTSTKNN